MTDAIDLYLAALAPYAKRGELDAFLYQGQAVRWCARPVRLKGRLEAIDKEGKRTIVATSASKPNKVVLKACGNRRASVCPACSSLYRSDARHIVRAGLTGEKDVGEHVRQRPSVFLTLTAPSFGKVHSASGATCHRGDPKARCPHAKPTACFSRHHHADEVVGSPLCEECFDYEKAVLHNALTPELWRRFTIYLPRALAQVMGMTQSEAKKAFSLNYCRVAEFQRRGLVHIHAVIRADGPGDQDPPPELDAGALGLACHLAVHSVSVSHQGATFRFGSQLDVQVLNGDEQKARKVAAYVAKYATKSADDSGILDRRLRRADEFRRRGITGHVGKMAKTAWRLGNDGPIGDLRLQRHAHSLGYGGLFLTKSRCYSTTFRRLREARAIWRRTEMEKRLGLHGATYVSSWKATGAGWSSATEASYAAMAAKSLEAERRLAWDEITSR